MRLNHNDLMETVKRKPTYIKMLQDEFTERRKRREHYSQNAFARDLGLSPARLSQILSQKSGLSTRVAVSISKILGFSEGQTALFVDSVISTHSRSLLERERARKRLMNESYQSDEEEPEKGPDLPEPLDTM